MADENILGNASSSDLKGLIGQQYMLGGLQSFAGSFASIAGSALNYGMLKADSYNLDIQASNIELQAQQRANQLREQFLGAIGSYQFGAAQRGVSVGSGSVRSNLESSAMNIGQDIQIAQKNADLQAKALRTQATSMRKTAKAQHTINTLGAVSNMFSSIGNYATGADLSGSWSPFSAGGK